MNISIRVKLVVIDGPGVHGADVEAAGYGGAAVAQDCLDVEEAVAGAVVHVEGHVVVGVDALEEPELVGSPVFLIDVGDVEVIDGAGSLIDHAHDAVFAGLSLGSDRAEGEYGDCEKHELAAKKCHFSPPPCPKLVSVCARDLCGGGSA